MVGERIRQLRTERNMTIKELAQELEIGFTTLGNYERGDREPDLNFIIKVAKYFGVSMDYITGYEEVKNYDEFLLMNDFNNVSQILHYDDEIRPIILNLFHRLTAITFDLTRSHSLEEAELLNQIIESTFNMKAGLGFSIQRGGYSGELKFEYSKRFLSEKEKIDNAYHKLLSIYANRKLL